MVLQAGAIALIQALILMPDSAALGCFMAAKVSNVANQDSGALIRRRLAAHNFFLPAWISKVQSLIPPLPPDTPEPHLQLHPAYRHLWYLICGLGAAQVAGGLNNPAGHAGIMFSGKLTCLW